jgi:N-acetylglucosaminyldiphosphoundecaprenol N-acetyl-beta-D-mannosaminyltransferase
MRRIDILGVGVDSGSRQEILKKVAQLLGDGKKHYIVTPNPEFVVLARKDKRFARILAEADLAVPDGIGLILASRLFYGERGLKERVTGVDLMVEICRVAKEEHWSAFFLGAEEGVAEKCARKLKKKYGLTVLGTRSGWANSLGDEENRLAIEKKVGSRNCHFIFVAYGAGKQEKWIRRNLEKIPVRVAMGVGGAFDFLSGETTRAPRVVRQLGLEWLWRLAKEPWRWRRQMALLEFTFLVVKRKLKSYSFFS